MEKRLPVPHALSSSAADLIRVHVGLGAGEVVLAVRDGCDARPVPRTVEISLETLDLSEEHLDDNGSVHACLEHWLGTCDGAELLGPAGYQGPW